MTEPIEQLADDLARRFTELERRWGDLRKAKKDAEANVGPGPRILRRRQVEIKTGLSRSSLYLRIAKGSFPRPIPLGEGPTTRAVGWTSDSVDKWIADRIASSKRGA